MIHKTLSVTCGDRSPEGESYFHQSVYSSKFSPLEWQCEALTKRVIFR